MKKNIKFTGALFLALLTAGCANGVTPIAAAKPADVGRSVTLTPQTAWLQVNSPTGPLWTADGLGLDELHFYTGIKDRQPLFNIPGIRKEDLGQYRANMLPNDVQDLMVATLGKANFQNVRSDRLRPCPFGGTTGFCFDLTLTTPDGLEMRGRTLASKRPEQLDLLFFLAPSEYYYDAISPTMDQLFTSIQVH